MCLSVSPPSVSSALLPHAAAEEKGASRGGHSGEGWLGSHHLMLFFFFSPLSRPSFNVAQPAASSPAILSLFIFIYFIFFAHMGPDEMFEGSQHPFAYQQGRSSPVRRKKTHHQYLAPGSRAAPKPSQRKTCLQSQRWGCGSDCVSRRRDAELPVSLAAPSHTHTQCHTRSHWPPSFTTSYTIGFSFSSFFNPLQEFYCKLFQKRRDYSHFHHTSTINLLLDNVPLLLSVIAVAALPHLQATHFKNEQLKSNVSMLAAQPLHSFVPFFFFFFCRIQCLPRQPGNHKTAS